MPNVGIHFILAGRALERWAVRPAEAPFDPADAAALSAYLHGAVAPDLGYFPSGDRLFSELVHLVRSADFARALLGAAESEEQRAYAWGWVTHILADLAIHPLINRAAEELRVRQGDGDPLAAARAHMRVEYGLDIAFFGRHPEIERLRFTHPVGASTIAPVSRAFSNTYDLALDGVRLLHSHVMSARVSRAGLTYDRTMSAGFRRRPLHALSRSLLRGARLPLGLVPGVLHRSPLLSAVLHPVPPPRWLVSEVDAAVRRFTDLLASHCAQRLQRLENCDLVLGGVSDPDRPSPRTARALEELALRRSQTGGLRDS